MWWLSFQKQAEDQDNNVIQHQQYADAVQQINELLLAAATKLQKCQEPATDKQSVELQLECVQVIIDRAIASRNSEVRSVVHIHC